ncbi:hypothetical protein [Sphingobium sp. DC-2]|uniref:hypothetical protein n=1 Tax=Sphingobium sp. DC-2 TaxID=1303256 RepID=UPI0004C41061|nr:hypothetical protein [Sphingobium sp. DC-2]
MQQTAPFALSAVRRPGLLSASLVLAGAVAMSVHVGLLAAGVPFPLPQPPVWAQWLNEFFMAGALLAFLKLAHPSMAHRSIMARTIIAFVIMAAIQETLRVGIMSGVVTGAWAYSAIGLIRPLIRVAIVALSCVVAVRWVLGIPSLLIAALAIGAISTAARKLVAHALEPLIQHFAWLARPDLYAFPYPFHVTVAAYLSFGEAVAGAVLMTVLIWDGLPRSRSVRVLIIAFLVALLKGVIGNTLLYSAFTGESVLVGVLSWSQFLLEFLILGALVARAWDVFGRDREPARVGAE